MENSLDYNSKKEGGNIKKNLDYKDRIILSLLVKDSSVSLVNISKVLGISVTATKKRLAKLKDRGIIKQSTIKVNFDKLGYGVLAFIKMAIEPQMREHVITELKKIKNVIELYEVSGEYDIMAKVVVKNVSELRDTLLTTLTKIGGINKTSTMIIMKDHSCNLEKLFGEEEYE